MRQGQLFFRITLLLCLASLPVGFALDVSAKASVRGRIFAQPIEKGDGKLWRKRLDHPVTLGKTEFRDIMSSLRFARKLPVLWDKPEPIFDKNTVAKTSEAFRKKLMRANSREIILFSLNTPKGRTEGDLFILDKALNWRFSEIKGSDYIVDTQSVEQESGGEILVNWKLVPQKNQEYFYKSNALGMKIRNETWLRVPLKSLKERKARKTDSHTPKDTEVQKDNIKEKLRLLKQLKQEQLISDQDYEKKVKELLENF